MSAQPTAPAPGATLDLDVRDRFTHFCLVDAGGAVLERGQLNRLRDPARRSQRHPGRHRDENRESRERPWC
jgi:hypothetical protein